MRNTSMAPRSLPRRKGFVWAHRLIILAGVLLAPLGCGAGRNEQPAFCPLPPMPYGRQPAFPGSLDAPRAAADVRIRGRSLLVDVDMKATPGDAVQPQHSTLSPPPSWHQRLGDLHLNPHPRVVTLTLHACGQNDEEGRAIPGAGADRKKRSAKPGQCLRPSSQCGPSGMNPASKDARWLAAGGCHPGR